MLSALATLGIALVIIALCLIAPMTVQKALKLPGAWLLGLLVLGVLATGVNQACQAWCIRAKAFKDTSASQVIRSLTSNGAQVGFGYLKGGAAALIVATIMGDVLASLNLARVAVRDLRAVPKQIRWGRVWNLAKAYGDFPLYSASMNVINAVSLGLPVFALTHYFGIAVAGAYAFTMRILSAPIGLVQRALRQVLYQKACETHSEGGRLFPLYVKFTGGLLALSLVPTLILVLWSPQIFSWLFGPQWRTAGLFAQSIMLWLMPGFCNVPANLFSRIVRIQRQMFFYDLTLLALRILALYFGGQYLSASATVALFSLVGAVMNTFYIVIVGLILKRREGQLAWKDILQEIKNGLS